MPVPQESLMRWTVDDVRRMIESGSFANPERFERVEGPILDETGRNDPHIMAVMLAWASRAVFSGGEDVNSGIPVRLTDRSSPEPDLLVTRGAPSRPQRTA